jgi:hypothetical protein
MFLIKEPVLPDIHRHGSQKKIRKIKNSFGSSLPKTKTSGSFI